MKKETVTPVCAGCGKPTSTIDLQLMQYICSDECEQVVVGGAA